MATLPRTLRGIAGAFGTVLLVVWLVFAAVVIALRYAVLPNIDRYRTDIEQAASRASGGTVHVGAIGASWHGLHPSLELRDVTVDDGNGGRTLTLPTVRATLAWESLVVLQLRLASLEIDGPSLAIRRDADGQLYVAGFAIRKKATPDNKAAEWLLAQDGIRVRGATIVWHDEMESDGAPHAGPRQDLVLTDVAFALSHDGREHRAALRATPPSSLAAPLDLRATIEHPFFASRLSDPATWSGEVYADVATGDIVAWKEWLPLPSTIDAGHGRVRAWMTFAPHDAPAGVFAQRLATRIKRPIPADLDRIASLTADLALDDVAVRWGAMADAPEYSAIGSIDGRLAGSQSMTEQRLAAIHMALQPRSGTKVAPPDFEMRRTIGAGLDDETGTASLGAIDIGVSLGLVPGPLVPPAIAERLAALKPRGALQSATARWAGPFATPRTFEGKAEFSRLSIAPQAPTPEAIAAAAREVVGANGLVRRPRPAFGQPGVQNLAGTVIATRTLALTPGAVPVTTAVIALQGDDVTVIAPGLFDEPDLRLAHLAANVAVRVDGTDLEVKVDHAALDNADLAGTVDVTFRHGPNSGGLGDNGGRGWLDVDAKLSRADVGRVPRYLPNIIGERARVYLRRSLIAGKISEATLRMRGPIEHLNLREMPGALATPNPVSVPDALVAIRDHPPSGGRATPGTRAVGEKKTGTDFAQADDTGGVIFHAVIKAHDATFRYGPGRQPGDPPPLNGIPPSPAAFIPWPAFEDVDADIVFDLARLTVHARSARVYDYRLTDITAELPALADPEHVLRVVGHGTGPIQDLMHFIKESPVSFWLRHFTDNTKATGNAALSLALDLPLTHPRESEVAGSLQFAHNDLALNAIVPPLLGIDGRMDFSDRGLAINGITATALGGPLRIDAKTGKDGYIALDANGTIDVAALQKSEHDAEVDGIATPVSDAVDRAATFLSGSAQYKVALRVRSKRAVDLSDSHGAPSVPNPDVPPQPDLVVQSDLKGLAIALPAPMTKPADATWPLRIELARTVSTSAETPDTEDIRVALADQVDVSIARQRNADGQLVVTHAGYSVGAGDAPRVGASQVAIDVPSIDVDAWRAALRAAGPPRPPAERPPPNPNFDNLLPAFATLKTGSLKAYGREFDHVAVNAGRTDAGWQADVASDQVEGKLSYTDVSGHAETRIGVAPVASGKLVARLKRLSIPQSETTGAHVDNALVASRQKDFPAIDVIVDSFELRGRPLGRLEVVADNVDDDDGRAWRLRMLGLTMPEARFSASGVWGHADAAGDAREHTSLDFDIQASDVGALMDRFGLKRTINRGTAKLSGSAAWQGGPSTIDFGTMSGAMKLEADNGQFLKAEPGVAKLLNILSLQGLARRLTLDFTDVFSPGFAFDTVRADAVVDRGILTTDDFTMRGVQAIVKMSGSADLEHETTNLHVRVEPQINAGAASLGLAVINPAVGLATFAAQYLFKDKISQALAFEYNVSGPWTKPDVAKIDRNGKVTPVVPKNASATSDPVGSKARTE